MSISSREQETLPKGMVRTLALRTALGLAAGLMPALPALAETAGDQALDLNAALAAAEDAQSGPSASELAPDADSAGEDQPEAPLDPIEAEQNRGPKMPGPPLKLSPQYADHIPPGETAADDAATSDATDADPDAARRVLADRLNLRSGPGTGHDVIGSVTRNQAVTPIGAITDGWVQVRLEDGREGWLADDYLSPP